MAYDSDAIIKEMLKRIGNCGCLKLKIFPEDNKSDQLPWIEGGLSFGKKGLLYGSCDGVWYKEEEWRDPFNEEKYKHKPIIAVEGTLALERGSVGSAQYQRFFHALGAVKSGVIGVYFLRGELPHVYKGKEQKGKMRYDLPKAALNASEMHSCDYLIITDYQDLKELIEAVGYNKNVKGVITRIKAHMESYFNENFKKRFKNMTEYFEKRSFAKDKEGHIFKILSTNYRNLTLSSQRGGHIFSGEYFIGKYMLKKQIYMLLPRLTKEEIEKLNNSNKKEWNLVWDDSGGKIVTIEDFEGVDNGLIREINEIRYKPTKEGTAYRKKWDTIRSKLIAGINDGTICLKKNLENFKPVNNKKTANKTLLDYSKDTSKGLSGINQTIKNIKKRPWTMGDYKKQNWGIWLHRVSSYVGRIKPSFAHWLIKYCSKEGDVVLDPFCGAGTILLEADLLNRKAIGIDLNPYAYVISKAKFDRHPLNEHLEFLKSTKLETEQVNVDNIPSFVKEYYHPKTLKELYALKDTLYKEKRFFLLGCLLGIAHGHRSHHLSITTGYIIPYIPKPKPPVVYKEVIPRLIEKVKRMYTDDFSLSTEGEIHLADARNMPLKDASISTIISSPPYYHTLDYIGSNNLRLAILGHEPEKQELLKKSLIQNRKDYLNEMKKIAPEILRVLKPKSLCVFVLGDVHTPTYSLNTAEDIANLYSKEGFIIHDIIPDEIPANKTTIVKFDGQEGITKKKPKMDRILIMETP